MNLTQKQINAWLKKAPKCMRKTLAQNAYDIDMREVPHDAIGIQQRVKAYAQEIVPQAIGASVVITFQASGLAIMVLKVEENLYYVVGNWGKTTPYACNEENLTKLFRKYVELHGVYKKLAKA